MLSRGRQDIDCNSNRFNKAAVITLFRLDCFAESSDKSLSPWWLLIFTGDYMMEIWDKSKEMSFMKLWYTAIYLNKLDLYSPLFVCNSLLQSNPWHWKFEMLYKLICIKNISNNETLSNILEIVIKYLNQINNFLGSLNKELLYKFFNSIEEFLKLNFRNLTAQATAATQQSWKFVCV